MQMKDVVLSFLNKIEKFCSKIPQPIVFFIWLMLFAIIFSVVLSLQNVSFKLFSIQNGETIEKTYHVRNILTADGVRFVLSKSLSAVSNSGIIPILIVAVIGLGLAEGSGYIKTLFTGIIGRFKSSKKIATLLLLTFGVSSNIAIDAGYVVLIPLGGMVFLLAGRNPILGVIVTFMAVSGGFAANFFLGGTDVILAGLTTTAANAIMPGYVVAIESNYYFSIASSIVVVLTGYFITEYILSRKYDQGFIGKSGIVNEVSLTEKRAFRVASVVALFLIALVLVGVLPKWGILRNQETGDIWKNSPFSYSIIFLTSFIFGVTGFIYGKITKKIEKADDAIKIMAQSVSGSATSLIGMIFAYQFLNMLEFSGIGMWFASILIGGIKAVNLTSIPFLVAVTLSICMMNLLISSNSVKWSAISYVLIPVFVSFGYTPEFAQAVYRIGDSTTNIISPAMVYMPIVLGEIQKYKKDATMGTIISMTLPYTIGLLIVWVLMLVIFVYFNLPIGPNASIML